jgi:hypothetical protein
MTPSSFMASKSLTDRQLPDEAPSAFYPDIFSCPQQNMQHNLRAAVDKATTQVSLIITCCFSISEKPVTIPVTAVWRIIDEIKLDQHTPAVWIPYCTSCCKAIVLCPEFLFNIFRLRSMNHIPVSYNCRHNNVIKKCKSLEGHTTTV